MYPERMSGCAILKEIISITGCDKTHSRNTLKTLKNMGLEMFSEVKYQQITYDVLSFAVAKRILTAKEDDHFTKREENEKKEEQRYEQIERKYKEKYGQDQSRWSKQISDQMHDEMLGRL